MGSQSPKTSSTTVTGMNPEQSNFFNMAFPFISQYGKNPLEMFQGSGITDFNPNEVAGQKGALDAAGSTIPGLSGAAAADQSKLLDPNFILNPSANPFINKAIGNASDITRRELTEGELPSIRSQDAGAGGGYSGGSTRAGIAEGLATERTNRAISDSATNAFMGAYNKGLDTMTGAIANNPNVMAQQLFGPEVTSAVGGQQRAMDQAKLSEAIQKFYTGQELPFLQGQELLSLIGNIPGGSSSSTGTGAVPGVNPIMGAIGGAGALGSLFSGMGKMGGSFSGLGDLFGSAAGGIGSMFSGLGSSLGGMFGGGSLADLLPFLAMA